MYPPPLTVILRSPTVTLTDWTVFEVTLPPFGGMPTWHMVGIETKEHTFYPRVSSPIMAVDNVMQTCATRGGDIYHLSGEHAVMPGEEMAEWAAWKNSLRIHHDRNVTQALTGEFERLNQQLSAYLSEPCDDFPMDWFLGIPAHGGLDPSMLIDAFQLDKRRNLCMRLAVQCAQLFRYESGDKSRLQPLRHECLIDEALRAWNLSVYERRWITKLALEIELD